MEAQPTTSTTPPDTTLLITSDSGASNKQLLGVSARDSGGAKFCSRTKKISFVPFVKAKSQEKKQGQRSNLVYKQLESSNTSIPFPDPRDNNFDAAMKIFKSTCHVGSEIAGIAVVKTQVNQCAWSVNYVKKQTTSYNDMHHTNSFPDPSKTDFGQARSVFQRYSPHGSVVTKITTTQPQGLPARWCVLYRVEKKRRALCTTIRRFVSDLVMRLSKEQCVDQTTTNAMKKDKEITTATSVRELLSSDDNDLSFEVVDKNNRMNRMKVRLDALDSESQIPRKIYLNGVDITCTMLGRTRFTWGDINRIKSGHHSILKVSKTKKSLLTNVSTYVRTVMKSITDSKIEVAPTPVCELVNYKNIAAGKMSSVQNIVKVRRYLVSSSMRPSIQDVKEWVDERNFTRDVNTHGKSAADAVFSAINEALRYSVVDFENISQYEYAAEISAIGLKCTPDLWIVYLESVTKDFNKISEVLHVLEAFQRLR